MSEEILCWGINYTRASVDIREQLSIEKLQRLVMSCRDLIQEHMILATCNRTELYLVTSDKKTATKELASLFPAKVSYSYANRNAVEHLFTVAAGLDSMILGEPEILSQIKRTYKNGSAHKTIGKTLHQLVQETIRVSKLVRSNTKIAFGVTSLTSATLMLAEKQLKTLCDKKIILIGAGDVVRKMLVSLQHMNALGVTVVNRSLSHAKMLTTHAQSLQKLPTLLETSDVVISATSSPDAVISLQLMKDVMKKRKNQPICLIDLAVPRDIDGKVGQLKGVQLFNIDDLQKTLNIGLSTRKKAAGQAKNILAKEIDKFLLWHETQHVVPIVTALSKKAEEIRAKELEQALRKLSHLSVHDKKVVATLAKRIEGKMIARLLTNVKTIAKEKDGQKYLQIVQILFEL